MSRHAYLPIENTRRDEGKSGDVINLFAQRIAIISCIKSIAGIDGQILFLGSTHGMLNVTKYHDRCVIKDEKDISKYFRILTKFYI